MRLLVLGHTGQLGYELMRQSPDRGFAATGMSSGQLNVTDPAGVRAALDAIGPAWVMNTTAFHVVPECEQKPEQAFAVNAAAVKHLAESCAERGIGFATYSTDYVFDGAKGTPYVEDDVPRPLQTYGVTKLAGELLCALLAPDALIIRTCGVYGGRHGSRSKKGNFALTVLRDADTMTELEVSSEQMVNPTLADDLAAASLALIARRPVGGIYHLGSEGACSWAEFAAVIVEAAGRSMRIVPVDRGGHSGAARRPAFSALANRRAAEFGVTLPHWRDGIERYLVQLAEASAR